MAVKPLALQAQANDIAFTLTTALNIAEACIVPDSSRSADSLFLCSFFSSQELESSAFTGVITMCEFNVSRLVDSEDCGQLSGSAAELGENAGRITWQNCLDLSSDIVLVTEENAAELRDYFAGYGAWDREEIAAWTLQELNALCIQEAASNIREFEDYCESDWQLYYSKAESGSISGQLYHDEKTGRTFCQFSR